jgi:hypothetical protein
MGEGFISQIQSSFDSFFGKKKKKNPQNLKSQFSPNSRNS